MENLSLLIYLISICDEIKCGSAILVAVSLICLVLAGIAFVSALVTGEEATASKIKPILIRWIIAPLVVCTVLSIFVPSSKTVAAMYVIPKIAQSETVQELGQSVVDLAKAWIQEAMPEKKGMVK